MKTIVVHWPKLASYHVSRLAAAHQLFQHYGMSVVALEMAEVQVSYLWGKELQTAGFPRRTLFSGHAYQQLSPVRMARKIFSELNAIGPDVVAVNGYSTGDALAILLWARLNRRPAILMSESKMDDVVRRMAVKEMLKSCLVKQYGAALCGGRPHKAYLQSLGMDDARIFLGYDAVDNEYFRSGARLARHDPARYGHLPGLETGEPYFLASGRFLPRKNFAGLLQAYHHYRLALEQRGLLPWRLVILGDGQEKGRLEQLLTELELQGVTLAGARPLQDLPAYYGLARAFIHPALQEQWGLVVNEAMASGLPVLVSDTCGCAQDLVIERVNGYTFDPHNPDELADLMALLSHGSIDLPALGKASQEHIKQYSPDVFAQNLYQAVLSLMKR